MNAATANQPGEKASLFSIRHNWLHLARRPGFQEPVLDGVRAVAIIWVLSVHLVFFHLGIFPEQAAAVFTNPLTGWIMRGDLALDLFFVISGFLMGSMLFEEFRKNGNLFFARFYVRRFLRLIPVYVVAMLLGLYFCHDLPGMDKWGNAETIWANLFYVNNFVPIEKQYMGWCWSLAVEEQFYILLPASILVFMGLGRGRLGDPHRPAADVRYRSLHHHPRLRRRPAASGAGIHTAVESLVQYRIRQAVYPLRWVAGGSHSRLSHLLPSAAVETILCAGRFGDGTQPRVYGGDCSHRHDSDGSAALRPNSPVGA